MLWLPTPRLQFRLADAFGRQSMRRTHQNIDVLVAHKARHRPTSLDGTKTAWMCCG
jgi:hypothetical protein